MRKLMLFLFLGLFMISSTSAMVWDNIVYYDMENGTGSYIFDLTNNLYNASLGGSPTFNPGLIGNALSCSGNDWIAMSNASNKRWTTSDSTFSVSLWVNGSDQSSGQLIYDTRENTDRISILINGTDIILNLDGNASATMIFGTDGAILDGSWHNLIFTQNNKESKVYLDGESVANKTNYPLGMGTTPNGAALCANGGLFTNSPFTGQIDELGIWNRTLNNSEVLELWNNSFGLEFILASGIVSVDTFSPIDNFDTINENITFKYNLTSTLDFNLTNTTLFVFYENGTLFRNITNSSLNGKSQNITNEIKNITIGTFNWYVVVFGESGGTSINSISSNRTFKVTSFTVGGYSYNTHVFETSTETFIQNITTESGFTVTSATLIYNGTNLGEATTTNYGAGLFGFSKTSAIPIGIAGFTTENRSFFWSITLTEISTGTQSIQNTSAFQQNVSELLFEQCGTLTEIFVNFTATNETNLSEIDFIMDATFNFWLGEGDIFKNISIDSSTEVANYTFCSNNGNLTVSSIINVQSTGYDERTFFFEKREYNNVTITNETMPLLQTGIGTSVIVQVTDPGLVPLEGIFVNVYRFYPGTNEYKIIERAKTDEFGQFVAKLIEPNTIKYQFEFLNDEGTVLKRTTDVAIACRLTVCLIRFVIEDTTDDFERFDNVTDFQYTLSFSNVTNTFIYTWNDITGDSITSRLLVEKVQFNGTTTVCDITSTSLASSLTCDVSSLGDGKYRTQVFRTVSGEQEKRISLLDIEIGGTIGIFGKEGLFWGFFLIFTMAAVGSFNPTAGVLLYWVGFIGLGALGVISMSLPVIIAMTLIGVLFIWAFRT